MANEEKKNKEEQTEEEKLLADQRRRIAQAVALAEAGSLATGARPPVSKLPRR